MRIRLCGFSALRELPVIHVQEAYNDGTLNCIRAGGFLAKLV
jgi:hypothetical protein